MNRIIVATIVCTTLGFYLPVQRPAKSNESAVAAVLDDWHKAAAAADGDRYFGHLAADAVFLGTDATERWTREAFREYAKPHFAKGTGWSFKSKERHVSRSKDGSVAWFDELLDTEKMGTCRGSGVLLIDGGRWKITQYNLSVPIPNEAFPDVKKIIDASLKAKPSDKKP